MPTYVFSSPECNATAERQTSVSERNVPLLHCKSLMERVIMPVHIVGATFQSYRAVGGAGRGRLIRSRNEHRGYLSEHHLIEVGNDSSMAPKSVDPEQFMAEQAEIVRDMQQIDKAATLADIPSL